MRFAVLLICLLILAGCSAEERRGNSCTSASECSWCDGDYAMVGKCEARYDEHPDEKICGMAETISCTRVIGPNGTCSLEDGMATCVEKTASPAETPSETPEFSDLSAYPECEDGGTCNQYQHCDPSDGYTLMSMDCIRGHCVPGTHVDCKARFGVICVEAYLTQHGQMMKDANGQLMTGGVCAGHANER